MVSCGARIDPRAPVEEYHGDGGIVGLRRRLDALRTRETIIVPLSSDGGRQAATWRDMYDAEPRWLEEALTTASLPGISAIEAGWSAPASDGPAS